MFVHWYWRSLRVPASRGRWLEYFGVYPKSREGNLSNTVVFHAVSVGEVHAATPLIREFLWNHPDHRVVVTTSTPTGYERVRALFGDSILHFYLPYDLPGAVDRFLKHLSPKLLVILETELWPNLIHACHERGIRLLLGNARLSDKSARRYALLGRLTREMLGNIDRVAAQAEADARRFCKLGLPDGRVVVTGNMKYDMWFDEAILESGYELRRRCFSDRPVLIAVSTREGEDEKVIYAFQKLLATLPDACLILVPRHPERFTSAKELCREAGLITLKRSDIQDEPLPPDLQVLVGDSMGEIPVYLSSADVAFVGGSLVKTGCQNILEPAALGLPVITGPSLYNFQQVSDALIAADAMRVVADEEELAEAAGELLTDDVMRRKMANAAAEVIRQSDGASRRTLALIMELLDK